MFGYVRPYKPELKVRDFATYRAVYCGLCRALGKRYSVFARLVLSYDMTFLTLLQLALAKNCEGFEKRVCPVKPLRRCRCCTLTSKVALCADTQVILSYYKLRDNLQDSSAPRRIGLLSVLPLTCLVHRSAAARSPQIESLAARYMSAQRRAEKSGAGIDEAAHPTAEMMADLLALVAEDGENGRVLHRMGYFLGRWIYFTDAADDLEKDVESGNFNPFIPVYSLKAGSDFKAAREKIRLLLNSCTYEISAAFELLSFRRYRPIFENIVYLGLPDMQNSVLLRKKIRAL